MNEYLLDTHVLLWWLFNDPRLSYRARDIIRIADNRVWISAASAWEISTKYRLGKLAEAGDIVTTLPELIAKARISTLAIELEDSLLSGSIDHDHRDPFDRMIAAQSMRRAIPVVTTDDAIGALGARVIW